MSENLDKALRAIDDGIADYEAEKSPDPFPGLTEDGWPPIRSCEHMAGGRVDECPQCVLSDQQSIAMHDYEAMNHIATRCPRCWVRGSEASGFCLQCEAFLLGDRDTDPALETVEAPEGPIFTFGTFTADQLPSLSPDGLGVLREAAGRGRPPVVETIAARPVFYGGFVSIEADAADNTDGDDDGDGEPRRWVLSE